MKFFEAFKRSQNFTPEQIEARRVAEYYRHGCIAEQDKADYVSWLEQQLTSRLGAADRILLKGDDEKQENKS